MVTWNSRFDVEACLSSIQAQTVRVEPIVVVDNASTDGTPDFIAERFPSVKLKQQTKNLGFAAGNNIAWGDIDAEWILTLNPDAWIEVDFVEALLTFAKGRPRIGIVGGKLLNSDAASQKRKVIDSLGIEIFRSRRVRDFKMGEEDEGQYTDPFRVFGVCAAAALHRVEMLRDTAIEGQVFPEHFFAYYEDADLAWRAWRRGWEAWTVPQAVGWHRRGGSPAGRRFSRELTHRNRLWLIARNEPLTRTLGGWSYLWRHEALMILRMLRYPYLFRKSWEAWRRLPRAIQERRSLSNLTDQPPPFQEGIGFSRQKNIQKTEIKTNKVSDA